MKEFNMNTTDDFHTSQSNLMSAEQQQQQQQSQRATTQQDLYSSGSGRQSAGIVDEMQQDLTYLSREAPLDGGESTFGAATSYSQLGLAGATGSQRGESVLHMGSSQDQLSNAYNTRPYQDDDLLSDWQSRQDGAGSPTAASYNYNEQALNQLSPDNVDIQRPLQQAGQFQEQQSAYEAEAAAVAAAENLQPREPSAAIVDAQTESAFSHLKTLKPFLVSFMVDARGGAMRGCRHSGVRVIIPPNSAQMPMRITCRYLRRERLVHPPPLMEGEACASKIMEVGPAGAKFLAPVLIEVPHFASLRGKEREVIILRSDSGEVWREHLFEADQRLVESIIRSAGDEQSDKENASSGGDGGGGGDKKRLTRIITNEFPQYFAIISRVRQEVHPVGPDGSTVDSQVVDKVQAIFTEGALTKRIKIGLQKNIEQQRQQQQQQQQHQQHQDQDQAEQSTAHEERSGSPSADSNHHQQQDRAVSPQSGGSGTAKRRSRFLACFGAGHGSIEPLNGGHDLMANATDGESSAAGGDDSPRQPCKEKPVKKRFILGDVEDSDGESAKSSADNLSRKRRHVSSLAQEQQQLVPDDYYIEQEPPLILNVEPKTYGKRMASSSAQTDSKLNGSNGFIMSTSAKKPKKSRRGLLGRRRHKTQMNICCEPAPARPKSVEPVAVDSSLESAANEQLPDSASMIHDVVTSDDLKWRTCTIQTDSDSVTVNYVTIGAADQQAVAAIAEATAAATPAGDDGYVSGSGELKKESSFGKGLFSLSFGSASNASEDSKQVAAGAASGARKRSKERKEKAKSTKETTSDEEEKISANEADMERPQRQSEQTSAPADESPSSISPTAKELKLKLKQERQERLRREKEEKRLLKEAEDAAAKADKLRRKQEKEAKKAQKLAQKSAKKSPPQSKPTSPAPPEVAAAPAAVSKSVSQVKFAADLVSSDNHEPVKQLDSIQNVIDSTKASYQQQKELLSQEDGRDMVEISISDSNKLTAAAGSDPNQTSAGDHIPVLQQDNDPNIVSRALEAHNSIAKTLQDGRDELERAEEKLISLSSNDEPAQCSAGQGEQQQQPLRPILKQQSTCEEFGAELTIGDERSQAGKLVSEATEEAVRVADKLKSESSEAGQSGVDSPVSSASRKEEKERLKREAKEAKLEKERLAKEAKKLAKQAEAEAKKAAKEAKVEAERQAKAAKAEQERLAKEAKLEKERLAKEAKAERERQAKEVKKIVDSAVEDASLSQVVEEQQQQQQQQQVEQPSEGQAQSFEIVGSELDRDVDDSSAADDSQAKEVRRRFKLKFPKLGVMKKKSSSDKGIKSDESEATTLADDGADNSAAIAAAATQVVEVAVAEAERLVAAQIADLDQTDKGEPKVDKAPSSATETETGSEEKPAQVEETLDAQTTSKKEKKAKSSRFKFSFPKFGSSESPAKSATDESKASEDKLIVRSGSESSSEAKLAEALEALNEATLEAKREYARLAKEAEVELSDEAKERKLELAQQAKEKADDAEEAVKEAKKRFKLGAKFKVKLPKFGTSPSPLSPGAAASAAPADRLESRLDLEVEESPIAGQKATDVSIASPAEASGAAADELPKESEAITSQLQTAESMSAADDSNENKSKKSQVKEKKEKKEKRKKVKKPKKVSSCQVETGQESSESEPNTTTTTSKSSFFSRLFSSKSSRPKVSSDDSKTENVEQSVDVVANKEEQQDRREPLIVSEMYPSDPDDEDGEMILEVNVPHDLIQEGKQQRKQSVPANEVSQASDTLATTIDETLATSTVQQSTEAKPSKELASMSSPTISIELLQPEEKDEVEKGQLALEQDDQATLVNVSQMVTSDSINHDDNDHDDDDATENLVSQTTDLVQELPTPVTVGASKQSADPHEIGAPGEEQQSAAAAAASEGSKKKGKASKEELKAERARKDLEAKLEKEAKKQAKEEAKLKKRQAKEEKLRAEMAKKMAKRQAKEEEELKKRQAKELKRLEKTNKKEDKKKAAKKRDPVASAGRTSAAALASGAPSSPNEAIVVEEEPAPAETNNNDNSTSRIITETPINTETEIERIVEEVVGEDGILTKTTKLIETKYVTTRHEELRTSEHREIPLEEYEQMKMANVTEHSNKEQVSLSSSSSFASSGQHRHEAELGPAQVKVKQVNHPLVEIVVPAYEHKQLDELRSTPSFFGPQLPEGVSSELSPKKAMKKRIKLNKNLIKQAYKLAKSESKRAKRSARAAESEISVCDEAAKQAGKELKRAVKAAKKAKKMTRKAHKKMDKVDKKLAKREKKIQKKQRELDKRAAKLAKKEAKRRAKLEAKEAKKLRRSSSGSQGGSRKSIKLEDIGEPVLKSASRLSIGDTLATTSGQQPDEQQQQQPQRTVIERDSPASEDLQVVEMSLEDNERQHEARASADLAINNGDAVDGNQPVFRHETTTTTIIEHPDGQVSEQTCHQVLTGQEAAEAARRVDEELGDLGQADAIAALNGLPEAPSGQIESQPHDGQPQGRLEAAEEQ